jgi:hypothetical protein
MEASSTSGDATFTTIANEGFEVAANCLALTTGIKQNLSPPKAIGSLWGNYTDDPEFALS